MVHRTRSVYVEKVTVDYIWYVVESKRPCIQCGVHLVVVITFTSPVLLNVSVCIHRMKRFVESKPLRKDKNVRKEDGAVDLDLAHLVWDFPSHSR